MIKEIDVLFFDIGSTLVDERKSDECRIAEIAKASALDYEQCFYKIKSFFAMNKNGYHKAVKELNIKMPAWHSEYERLYSGA